MVLESPAMNRSFNRENPNALIMTIIEAQIIRCSKGICMGPLKPATEMSGATPQSKGRRSSSNLKKQLKTQSICVVCLFLRILATAVASCASFYTFLLIRKTKPKDSAFNSKWSPFSQFVVEKNFKFSQSWISETGTYAVKESEILKVEYIKPAPDPQVPAEKFLSCILFYLSYITQSRRKAWINVTLLSMEKDAVKLALEMAARDPTAFNEVLPHWNPNLFFQGNSFDVNDQSSVMGGFPVLAAAMAGESLFPNQVGDVNLMTLMYDSSFESRIMRNVPQIGTSGTMVGEAGIQDQSARATGVSASSLDAFLAGRSGVQQNLEKSTALRPPVCQLQPQTIGMISTVPSNTLYGSSEGCGYQELPSNMDNFLNSSELGRITASRGLQKLPSSGDPIPNGWLLTNNIDLNVEGHDSRSNELSLSPATSKPLLAVRMNGIDQCSEVNCSDAALDHINATRSGLETCSNRRFSMGSCANNPAASSVILGSRYLSAIQEILAQIARYSLENVDKVHGSAAGIPAGIGNLSSNEGVLMDADTELEIQINSSLQSDAVEANKTRLLTLLQLVDEHYNHCVDEIHTVVSAFHAAIELDPRVHAHFALQTISHLFKGLRERISSCILAAGSHFGTLSAKQKDNSFESSSILKRWALQQLKRKDHHIWRPQRGLPEKAVSVLRAWMFQNFLHPYPKDAEKHLLAVKSGLSRSQVSNWFINARVRLWKPMIEEMCAEMNRRNACGNNEEDDEHESRTEIRTSICNQRFSIDD